MGKIGNCIHFLHTNFWNIHQRNPYIKDIFIILKYYHFIIKIYKQMLIFCSKQKKEHYWNFKLLTITRRSLWFQFYNLTPLVIFYLINFDQNKRMDSPDKNKKKKKTRGTNPDCVKISRGNSGGFMYPSRIHNPGGRLA